MNLRPFHERRASTSWSSGRTPRAPTPARAASCARARPTRWPPRARSTPAWAWSAASASPSTWPAAVRASTSRWCTRPTCSPSRATSGSAPSTTSHAEYPDVATAYNHVDAACIYFVQDPGRYDVIVTDNLFGDILTDLGGAVSGGIGLASSANLNPARTGPSLFEPVHGSAPDIVGTGKANPTAAVLERGVDARPPRRGRRRGPHPARPAPNRPRARRRRSATSSPVGSSRRPRYGEGLAMPITPTEKIWMNGELVPWAGRQDPRPHPHAPLRHRRVRGHPRLRDAPGPWHLPAHRPHHAPVQLGPHPHDGPALHARGDRPGVQGHGAGHRPAVVLRAADRLLRLRRDGAQHAPVRGRRRHRLLAVGRLPGRGSHAQGRAHEDQLVGAPRPQHHAAGLQDHRQLRQLLAGQGRGAEGRLRRGHHAQRRWAG